MEHVSSASYHMDKKFIDYILSESGILAPDRKDEVSLLALKSVATGGKLRELKNCFRVYGAQMERPPQRPIWSWRTQRTEDTWARFEHPLTVLVDHSQKAYLWLYCGLGTAHWQCRGGGPRAV